MKTDQIVAKILDLENQIVAQNATIQAQNSTIQTLVDQMKKVADRRGPKSEREMSDDDARRVMGGDLANKPHKDAAESLGLSYAQVYSARKGFTFKHIAKEILEAKRKAAETQQTPA